MRGRIRATLSWAEANGFVDRNAAGEAISAALPSMPSVKTHHRALPYGEVPAALRTIEMSRASLSVRASLRLLVLTATRSGEARLMTWAEVDLSSREWRIPASRTKSGVEHRVPLVREAIEVLRQVEPLRHASDLVVPSPVRPGRPLSDMALSKALRDAGVACVPHGFRASFRTWCQEATDVAPDVAEAALGHRVGSSVERSYARSDLFEKRRALMDRWGAFLQGGTK